MQLDENAVRIKENVMSQLVSIARYFVLTVLALIAATGVLSARGLYADGPFFLYQMLTHGGFYTFDAPRVFAQFVMQVPVYLAIEAGLRDLNAIIRIHSFGFVGLPVGIWFAALVVQFRTSMFWWLTLAFSVTYLRSGFFAAGEYNLTYALVALSVALLFKKVSTPLHSLWLMLSAFILIYSYESMSFLGLFLFVVAAVKLFCTLDVRRLNTYTLVACAGMYLFASYSGIYSTFFRRAVDLQATLNYGAVFEPHIFYLWCTIACAAIAMFGAGPHRLKFFAVAAAILASLCYLVFIFRWDTSKISYGYYSYSYRSWGAFMLLGVLVIAWFTVTLGNRFKSVIAVNVAGPLCCIALLVFVIQSTTLLFHTVGYYRWLKQFETVALSTREMIPIDEVVFNKGQGPISGYNWPWTNSALSVLLRGNAEAIVTNARKFDGVETFDPKTIEKYPLKGFTKTAPLYP